MTAVYRIEPEKDNKLLVRATAVWRIESLHGKWLEVLHEPYPNEKRLLNDT
jgi:hypothetical protein